MEETYFVFFGESVAMTDVVEYINSWDTVLVYASYQKNQITIEVSDGYEDTNILARINKEGFDSVSGYPLLDTYEGIIGELEEKDLSYEEKVCSIAEIIIRYIGDEIMNDIDTRLVQLVYLNNFMKNKMNNCLAWSGDGYELIKDLFVNMPRSFRLTVNNGE